MTQGTAASGTGGDGGDDRPHKPADDREEIYFNGPTSAWGHVGSIAGTGLAGLVLVAIPFVVAALGTSVVWWVYALCILVGVAIVAVPWIKLKSLKYRISNYRVDFERGVLWKRIDTIELWHVEDIAFNQSPLERIMGLGTINLVSRDPTTPRLTLAGLKGARAIFDTLKQRIIAVKRQRGVIKMDVGDIGGGDQ